MQGNHDLMSHVIRAADTDLSGTLDVGEFRDAMRRFGEEMDGRAVGARRIAVAYPQQTLLCMAAQG